MAEESEGGGKESAANAEERPKKQYASPSLRRLGTVRELTMGTHMTANPDARGTMTMTM